MKVSCARSFDPRHVIARASTSRSRRKASPSPPGKGSSPVPQARQVRSQHYHAPHLIEGQIFTPWNPGGQVRAVQGQHPPKEYPSSRPPSKSPDLYSSPSCSKSPPARALTRTLGKAEAEQRAGGNHCKQAAYQSCADSHLQPSEQFAAHSSILPSGTTACARGGGTSEREESRLFNHLLVRKVQVELSAVVHMR
eukprot:755915-Hanusia_phi.AAC.3